MRPIARFQLGLLLLLILAPWAAAQGWVRTYGGPGDQRANALWAGPDGRLTFTGRTCAPGDQRGDLWVVQVDSTGRELWQRRLGTPKGNEEGYALAPLGAEGLLVAGCGYPGSKKEDKGRSRAKRLTGLVHVFSPTGELRWSLELEQVELQAALALEDGVLLAGCERSGAGHAWLGLLDLEGRWRWTRSYSSTDSTRFDGLARLSDSSYVAVGNYRSAGTGPRSAWCVAVDETGEPLWQAFSGTRDDIFRAVAVHNGVVSCGGGSSDHFFLENIPVYNQFLLRLSSAGQPLDSLRVPTRRFELITALCANDSLLVQGGYSAGDPLSTQPSRIGVHVQARGAGFTPRWERNLDYLDYGMGKALLALPDGYVLAGLARVDRAVDADALLLRLDAAGRVDSTLPPAGPLRSEPE
ncbi:MAG: hypothetical protein WC326_09955 [Candidatus Delongbacteria bacterium]